MPVIRLSTPTAERIKRLAIPFEDKSPEHVIMRALNALEGKSPSRRTRPGVPPASEIETKHTRERTRGRNGLRRDKFRVPLLETVYELGGEATLGRTREIMEKKVRAQLDASDYKKVSTDEPRWWNDIKWLRNDLVEQGLFRKDSKRGVWQLTDAGVKAVESGRSR